MFKHTIKLALLPLAMGVSFAQAADVSKAELQKQLDQIQQRLADLEKDQPRRCTKGKTRVSP